MMIEPSYTFQNMVASLPMDLLQVPEVKVLSGDVYFIGYSHSVDCPQPKGVVAFSSSQAEGLVTDPRLDRIWKDFRKVSKLQEQ